MRLDEGFNKLAAFFFATRGQQIGTDAPDEPAPGIRPLLRFEDYAGMRTQFQREAAKCGKQLAALERPVRKTGPKCRRQGAKKSRKKPARKKVS